MVRCGSEVVEQGEISMEGLKTEQQRTFQKDFLVTGIDPTGKDIMWNFRGEIFDSELNETFGPMFMQGEKFDKSIEGIGYHFRVSPDGSLSIDKMVYRK